MMKNVIIGLIVAVVLIGGVWLLANRPMDQGLTNGGEVVECPVMGTKFPPAKAHSSMVYEGKTYYFCCAGCPREFMKNPEKYLNK
jgi:YHS domain-containing protein